MTETPSATSPRPALQALQADQHELLAGSSGLVHDEDDRPLYGLRDGFPDRRAAIMWYQRAVVRTWGHIVETWRPVDLSRDRTLLSALVIGDERQELVDDPLGPDVARAYRRQLERQAVLPACNRAYNVLRRSAGEYIESYEDDGDGPVGDIDPTQQDHVMMRPAFQWTDRRQARALYDLWGGFDTERELMDWLHDLDAPANGAADERLPAQVGKDPVALEHLVGDRGADDRSSRRYRERFAVSVVLEAFAEGIRDMSAGELAKRTSQGLTPAPG